MIPDDFTGLVPDLSNNDYHADTRWLSSSVLKGYLPEQYRQGGSQDALNFGSLFHTVVLEPERVALEYVALDAEKIGVKADGTVAQNPTMTAAWKKAVAEAESDGKTVIAQQDLARAEAMRDAVLAHDTAASLLFSNDGQSELSAFAADDTGLRHKARFDRLIPGSIVDLKSTSAKPGLRSLTNTVIDYGYELSAAHYVTVAELLGLDVQSFTLVFVGKEAPYRVTVADLDDMFIERGRMLRAQALERAHHKADAYEGASGRFTLLCPEWAAPDIEIKVA
jgi:hypothetical protein